MKEKTILVYFEFKNKKINDEDIGEMESLIESSGGEVCAISEVRKIPSIRNILLVKENVWR